MTLIRNISSSLHSWITFLNSTQQLSKCGSFSKSSIMILRNPKWVSRASNSVTFSRMCANSNASKKVTWIKHSLWSLKSQQSSQGEPFWIVCSELVSCLRRETKNSIHRYKLIIGFWQRHLMNTLHRTMARMISSCLERNMFSIIGSWVLSLRKITSHWKEFTKFSTTRLAGFNSKKESLILIGRTIVFL